MTKNGAFRISGLIIALVLCVHLNVSAQTAAFTKRVNEFYRFYLTNETKSPQKLKKFLSAKLYQEIQQMEAGKIDQFFTKKPQNMSLKDFSKFELDSSGFKPGNNQTSLYTHIFYKNIHWARMTVHLIVENGKWKINDVTGITESEVSEQAVEAKVETSDLQKNLINLEKPLYPPTAKAVHAFGDVKVEIGIDENGKVVLANVISGHPLLREVSRKAALESTFQPIVKDGKPVKSVGIIVYIFKAHEILYFPRTC